MVHVAMYIVAKDMMVHLEKNDMVDDDVFFNTMPRAFFRQY